MKITLAENIADITLEQFQKYELLNEKLRDEDISQKNYTKRKISLFSGIPYNDIDKVSYKDLEEVTSQIDKALDQDAPFVNRFKMNGIEYGFIPNFDNITTAEFVDLSKYGSDAETLHNLMAILFRPITKSSLGNYEIENYRGTDAHAETMKQTPMNVVNGALVFFLNLSSELENYILKYTAEELERVQKQQIISISGDGMQQ